MRFESPEKHEETLFGVQSLVEPLVAGISPELISDRG